MISKKGHYYSQAGLRYVMMNTFGKYVHSYLFVVHGRAFHRKHEKAESVGKK